MSENRGMEAMGEKVSERAREFVAGGGYVRTSAQAGGAPKWLKAARERFWLAHPYGKMMEYEEARWLRMMREAFRCVGEKGYGVSVAFGPNGAVVGVASWKSKRYESNYMNRHSPELYLAFMGTNGHLRGAGTALMVEVARVAVAHNRPAFAYVSKNGSFYREMGWEMIKADPSNDHWQWPLEVCKGLTPQRVYEAPSL